jgi:hypothetical protein
LEHLKKKKMAPSLYLGLELTIHAIKSQIHLVRQFPLSLCHCSPAVVENGHGHLEAVAHTAQHVLHRNRRVLKVHLCRVGALK